MAPRARQGERERGSVTEGGLSPGGSQVSDRDRPRSSECFLSAARSRLGSRILDESRALKNQHAGASFSILFCELPFPLTLRFPLSDAPTPVEFGVFGSVSLLDTLWVHGRVVAYLPPSSFSLSLLLYCCLSHSARLLGDCSARACPALFLLLTPAYFTLCVRPCMCKQLFSRALSTLLLVSDVFSFFFFIILPLSCWCCCCRGFFSFG